MPVYDADGFLLINACTDTGTVAEKVFVSLRKLAQDNPDVHCVAVSHSDESATDKWADAVGGGGHIEVIVDHDRKLYGAYGLGISSLWHVLSPWSMADVFSLGRSEGIGVRPTESGTRWQTAGTFGVDSEGIIRYAHVAEQASDMTGLAEALSAVKPIKAG